MDTEKKGSMDTESCAGLVRQAFDAREKAYAPYSGFKVGAALLARSGVVYTGCNIENAAFSPTNCAERTAFFKALSEGERHFTAIAIVGGPQDAAKDTFSFVFPCGVCRQVMAEFCGGDFVIVTARNPQDYQLHWLGDILPEAFGPGDLRGKP